jgi:hypothetical protein
MTEKAPSKVTDRYAQGPGKRSYKRRPQFALECNFGPVLDLSAGGMRIVSKKALQGVVEVTLQTAGVDEAMRANVVWCKKIGFRVYEVGLEFVDKQAVRHVVNWIATWSGGKPGDV